MQISGRRLRDRTIKTQMSRLFLLRHAKAAAASAGMRDFDRPLDATGRAAADAMGETMKQAGFAPRMTLCSEAARTRETLERVAASADVGSILFRSELYSATANGYIAAIRGQVGAESLMLVGHNPVIEEIANALSSDADPDARAKLDSGFRTCGLAVIRFEGPLDRIARGSGYLEAFLVPGAT